jgi:hypothetical protein
MLALVSRSDGVPSGQAFIKIASQIDNAAKTTTTLIQIKTFVSQV